MLLTVTYLTLSEAVPKLFICWTLNHSEFILQSCVQSYFVITALQMACRRDAKKLADDCFRKKMLSRLYYVFPSLLASYLSHTDHVSSKPAKCPEVHTIILDMNIWIDVQYHWHRKAASTPRKSFVIPAMLATVQTFSLLSWFSTAGRLFCIKNQLTQRSNDHYFIFIILWSVWDGIASWRACSSDTACWLCH